MKGRGDGGGGDARARAGEGEGIRLAAAWPVVADDLVNHGVEHARDDGEVKGWVALHPTMRLFSLREQERAVDALLLDLREGLLDRLADGE